MKKILLIILLGFAGIINAQFKSELNNPLNIKGSIIKNNTSSFILGFINPKNFTMRQSINMSFTSFGNQGITLGVYTNSISYKFNDKLNIEVDASLITSPYSSFGRKFSQQINGIYLSRAQLNYRPTKNTFISLQFSHNPMGINPYGFNGYSPFYRGGFFNMNGFDEQ